MKFIIAFLSVACLLTACSTATVPEAKTAEEYFNRGELAFANEDYQDAIKSYEKAMEIYETAALNRRAELRIADAHFANKDYVEAAAGYEDFLKRHPGTPQSARVLFQLGESYFNQILAIDRDQTATRNALVTFESLIKIYPDAPESRIAPERVRACKNHLAANELYVGLFYYKFEKHKAAIGRLTEMLDKYPECPDKDQVYYYLGRTFLDSGHPNLAVATFENLIADFPRSPLAAEAKTILREEF
ncbi:outer membrane protein assembly lipoprotein YfiO, putative [Syntrophotalea carbinolica DSM 2380]|uniref:Outer membrane protein assembly lipoprotein YfiO, putative n=1 Tax=Syntrophotalea carbinolica (strain DSM 2380 / NBRC 103641 / GraBd1) TaxID=338963 RepID=Q3A1Y5_SYNC1|nr:outer membrane protein assembly factor BamD [Syntrophotalea carbinolica]ABA89622.1 outer membrane protein assembly lipoprotein YfiO, putative [Syntrophotalea carbinolica DSM 2380]